MPDAVFLHSCFFEVIVFRVVGHLFPYVPLRRLVGRGVFLTARRQNKPRSIRIGALWSDYQEVASWGTSIPMRSSPANMRSLFMVPSTALASLPT